MQRISTYYNTIAQLYDKLIVPIKYDIPARELIHFLQPRIGSYLLDVGTGTGAALEASKQAVGYQGKIIGVDPSYEMVRLAREKADSNLLIAMTPGLPFSNNAFEAVTAHFVLSHFTDYNEAIKDLVRVLKPEGRIGFSTWGPSNNKFRELWATVVYSFINKQKLDRATNKVLPWEDYFEDPNNLRNALESSDLIDVKTESRSYHVSLTIEEYLTIRENLVPLRIMRRIIGPARWGEFKEKIREVFTQNFNQPIEYQSHVNFALGTKRN